MEFRTILNRERIYTEEGSPIVIDYKIEVIDKIDTLVECGEHNIYDFIQSYKDSCDLRAMINRYLKTGDDSIINKVKGFYMDTTAMPKEKMDWLNAMSEASAMFNKLPVDIRSKFDNDPRKFFIEIGTEEFNKKLSKNIENEKVEVKVDEQKHE